jgi:DNA-binding IclR family transcriptional regulator
MAEIQSIKRAVGILRFLARTATLGQRLGQVADGVGLNKPTTHRLLAALMAEGLVDKDPDLGLYRLGPGLYALGLSAGNRDGLRQWAYPAMLRLAERSADTVYLSVRTGLDGFCLERVEGSFPIKTLTLNAGDLRPLGAGAGCLALLAFLPDEEEIQAIIIANAHRFPAHGGLDAASVREMVESSRREGFSLNEGRIIPGITAVGVPIFDQRGQPVAALSVAGISSRMAGERLPSIVAWLREEASVIEAKLRSTPLRPAAPPRRRPGRAGVRRAGEAERAG